MLKIPVNADDHMQGVPDAPVTLVEYGDYECPHCGRAHPIVKAVQQHFGDRLAFVFRNFPLREIHPNAEAAAETAEFAAAGERFWEMHDALFENQEQLDGSLFLELAEAMGLPAPELRSALEDHTYVERVRTDVIGGIRSGVNGTPSFFINGVRHDDSWDAVTLIAAITAAAGKTA